ncbi:MAG: hypothetical protein RIT17_1185 [Pseudomonadota bacterium]
MFKSLLLTTVLAIATVSAPAAPLRAEDQTAITTLEVQFEGIEFPTGQVMLSLYDSEAAHDSGGQPLQAAAVKVEGDKAVARFTGLEPGSFAIKAFHDVDGDGKMGTNPFGMPIEPFAFSNNAAAQGGPARWQAASFAVAPGANQISITIK